jgi:hypothetical protein
MMNPGFGWLRRVLFVAVGLVLLHAAGVAGRGDKTGTAAASQLLIPVGAQSIALAGSSLSTVGGIDAVYWNVAGLARESLNTRVMFSHMSYIADIGVDYVALTRLVSRSLALGLTVKSVSVGQIPVTTEDFPDGTGATTSPVFLTIGGSIARLLSEKISVGGTVHYIYEKMGSVTTSGFAFNGGVQYVGLGGIDGLSVGTVIRNIGPKMQYDGSGLDHAATVNDALLTSSTVRIQAAPADLPSTIEVGLGYAAPFYGAGQISCTAAFVNNNYSDDEYRVGLDYTYDSRFSARLGYDFSSQEEGGESIYGFTGGLGVTSKMSNVDLTVNYAYRAAKYFSGNHIFELIIGF